MVMSCIQAQEFVSEALDVKMVDAELLAQAREHCRRCPECASFARGLAMLERAESPTPGATLADRVMAAVRAEASGQTDRKSVV